MKTLMLLCLLGIAAQAPAQNCPAYQLVDDYYRDNGTNVENQYRVPSSPELIDRCKVYPNISPWTGEQGARPAEARFYEAAAPAPASIFSTDNSIPLMPAHPFFKTIPRPPLHAPQVPVDLLPVKPAPRRK